MEEITTKTEFGRSYLVLENRIDKTERYLLEMLLHNRMEGVLICKEHFTDCESYLYYEITHKKPISKEYETKNMSFDDILSLFQGINTIEQNAASYLLEEKYFILDPDYIYVDLETEEYALLYVPFSVEPYQDFINAIYSNSKYYRIADFLLEKVNHRDDHAVNIAYQFYKMSKEDYFSISSFMNYIEKEQIMIEHEKESKIPVVEMEEQELESEKVDEAREIKIWISPVVFFLLSIGCIVVYFIVKMRFYYAFYLFILSVIMLLLGIVKVVKNVLLLIEQKKESECEWLSKPVSVEDYWQDNEKTEYFDMEKQVKDLCDALEWKEKGGTKQYIMEEFPFVIGKLLGEVDCLINDASVSRLHAKIWKKENTIHIQDLSSTNGTFVNGKRLHPGEETEIKKGDELNLGKLAVLFV